MPVLYKVFLWISFSVCFSAALIQSYIRTQTTILGYEVGRLKTQEIELLKKRSLLTMEIAKLTTKESLLSLLQQKTQPSEAHDSTE